MVQKKCVRRYVNAKITPVESIPGIRGRGRDKGEQ
jgi:hypothetical protein